MTGTHLQFRDWLRFVREGDTELVATYDDCSDCRATTFLTSFYVEEKTKKWRARWPREVAGAPLFSATPGNPGETDQVYALMMGEDGRALLVTWSHFQQKKGVPGEDYLFEYDVDPASGRERVRPIYGADAPPLKLRLCKAEGQALGIAAGQDTASCRPNRQSDGTQDVHQALPPSQAGLHKAAGGRIRSFKAPQVTGLIPAVLLQRHNGDGYDSNPTGGMLILGHDQLERTILRINGLAVQRVRNKYISRVDVGSISARERTAR